MGHGLGFCHIDSPLRKCGGKSTSIWLLLNDVLFFLWNLLFFFVFWPFVGCAKVYCHVDLLAARELPAMDDDGLVDPSYSIEVKDQAGMVTNGWRLPKMMEVWKRWDETA